MHVASISSLSSSRELSSPPRVYATLASKFSIETKGSSNVPLAVDNNNAIPVLAPRFFPFRSMQEYKSISISLWAIVFSTISCVSITCVAFYGRIFFLIYFLFVIYTQYFVIDRGKVLLLREKVYWKLVDEIKLNFEVYETWFCLYVLS